MLSAIQMPKLNEMPAAVVLILTIWNNIKFTCADQSTSLPGGMAQKYVVNQVYT